MEKKKSTLKEVLDEITKLERSNLSSEEMVTYLSTSDMDWSTLRAYSLLSGKDELASKYLFVSLYMMEKNKTTPEQIERRKRSRVRRLDLPPDSHWPDSRCPPGLG